MHSGFQSFPGSSNLFPAITALRTYFYSLISGVVIIKFADICRFEHYEIKYQSPIASETSLAIFSRAASLSKLASLYFTRIFLTIFFIKECPLLPHCFSFYRIMWKILVQLYYRSITLSAAEKNSISTPSVFYRYVQYACHWYHIEHHVVNISLGILMFCIMLVKLYFHAIVPLVHLGNCLYLQAVHFIIILSYHVHPIGFI